MSGFVYNEEADVEVKGKTRWPEIGATVKSLGFLSSCGS